MENCLYHGKTICTYDLKDENGIYYEELVLEWKQKAADRQLTCAECGAYVYLAAGPIKEPYFAHYDLENCDYSNGHETEELKRGKRLLYYLLRKSFPEGEIRARHRMENGMYSTLYCQTQEGGALAVDYRLVNNSLEKFQMRNSFYQSNHIQPVYVLGIRQQTDARQIDWYQSLLQSAQGYLIFLDADKENITLKKSFGYRLGKERRFRYCIKTYPIRTLKLNDNGQMCSDFTKACMETEQQLMEEKLRYGRQQEQLRSLRQEWLRRQEEEAQRHDSESLGLNPALLEKCRRLIAEGNAHLVSKKYYDAIDSENK